jgi:mono/diheme cytochrome c family protein
VNQPGSSGRRTRPEGTLIAAVIIAGAAVVGLAGGRISTWRTSSSQAHTSGAPIGSWTVAPQLATTPGAPGGGEGAALYATHCAACHGLTGEGQPNWKVTAPDGKLPAPPHDGTGHTWHHPDDLLLQIVADGGQFYSPNTGMPGFRDKLSPEQMNQILDHIKGMWGPDERSYQAEVSAESAARP